MKIEFVNRLVMFLALFLVQVLILNQVHLFGVGTPLLYVYFAITFRRNTPKALVLVWCFLLGLLIDIFSNTPGLAASVLTLVGLVQTYLLEMLVPRDSAEDLESSLKTLGLGKFVTLSALLTLLYSLLFFALEAFNFFNVLLWLVRAFVSAMLTMVLLLAVESVRSK